MPFKPLSSTKVPSSDPRKPKAAPKVAVTGLVLRSGLPSGIRTTTARTLEYRLHLEDRGLVVRSLGVVTLTVVALVGVAVVFLLLALLFLVAIVVALFLLVGFTVLSLLRGRSRGTGSRPTIHRS